MAASGTSNAVRDIAVMVRVQGPDPKGVKLRNHAFHLCDCGRTSISASGMLLPKNLYNYSVAKQILSGSNENLILIVTVASVVEPFLQLQHKDNVSRTQAQPKLIRGAHIDVMVEEKLLKVRGPNQPALDKGAPGWIGAQLIRLVDIPATSAAIQLLTKSSASSLDHGWEVGWSLAFNKNGFKTSSGIPLSQAEHDNAFAESEKHLTLEASVLSDPLDRPSARIAILGFFLSLKDLPDLSISYLNGIGDFLFTIGSPFGILSPMHFFNSISVGSISNCYPHKSSFTSLLLADIRCLPGMEGGPVFNDRAHLIGILTRPLRQKSSGAEIQLVIQWEAIATAWADLLVKDWQAAPGGIHKHLGLSCNVPRVIENVVTSICLITTNGIWASGITLSDKGLVLTNAHLLEPWRFCSATIDGGTMGMPYQKGHKLHIADSSTCENILIRLDHINPWIWNRAKIVYISKGPLDVALLQLENTPDQLHPINVNFDCPALGSLAFVVGHGLAEPSCGFSPSACSGIVAKIVKATLTYHHHPCHHHTSLLEGDLQIPAMLETTAAVHPGTSGGAVTNLEGHMIGLITSNARHGTGIVIPHLNFSIPSAVLAPIFQFARDMDLSLLQIMDKQNEELSSIWAVVPSPLPEPSKLQLESDIEQGKGSKFAKFIAARAHASNCSFASKL